MNSDGKYIVEFIARIVRRIKALFAPNLKMRDVFIVVESLRSEQNIILVTFSEEYAKHVASIDSSMVIVQPSGKKYPSNWKL